jgi:hypothetical protein
MVSINFVVVVVVAMLLSLIFSKSKSSELPCHITDEVIRYFASKGEKIMAIRCYQQLHGVKVRDARSAVEQMLEC